MNEEQIWAELGHQGFQELTRRFYEKVKVDDLMAPMYPDDDWEGAERRLFLFFTARFGGNPTYEMERGHPRLRARHMPFKINEAARDRWIKNMALSMEEMNITKETKLALFNFFSQIADFMRNQ